MLLHEKRLLVDVSHEISCLIFFSKIRKDVAKLSSAAVVIGTVRVNFHYQVFLNAALSLADLLLGFLLISSVLGRITFLLIGCHFFFIAS